MKNGFTLIELLLGSTIMLVLFLSTLTIYTQGQKISVDQQQYLELQQDVRAAAHTLAQQVRMAGLGLPAPFAGYSLAGVDNESWGGTETPDRLKIMGNIDDPLILTISKYQGSAATVTVEDFSFERHPYPDDFYDGKIVLILPNPASGCRGGVVRKITQVRHSEHGTNEGFDFAPGGAPGVNPPGGLSDVCADSDYFDGGLIMFIDVREFWLDVTGHAPGLTAGKDGYIGGGEGGILYLTSNGVHYPLAPHIENLQFQYDGDFDADEEGRLDGYANWKASWTLDQIGRIRRVRIMVLGRTRDAFASISKSPATGNHHYRRPALANTNAAAADDWHRRYLLESTSEIRNLSLSLYSTGTR